MTFLSLYLFIALSGSPLNEVRMVFPDIKSFDEADSYLQHLESDNSAESQGYKAAMLFMKSRYAKFPLTKFKYFKKGKHQLDDLILEHPNHFELHYIRFLLQTDMPDFLGYNKNLEGDYKTILSNLAQSKLPKTVKLKFLNHMISLKNLPSDKHQQLNQIMQNL